jgi:hypothetical protein
MSLCDKTTRVFLISACLTKTGKVLFSQKQRSPLIHDPEIKRIMDLPGIASQKRILAQMDIIAIETGLGGETCMKSFINLPDILHSNIPGKDPVQAVCQLFTIKFSRPVKMCHHHPGMHSGIRPSGSHRLYLLPEQSGQTPVKPLLDRDPIRLHLPTVIVCAVIGKSDKIPHCGRKVTKNNADIPIKAR